MWMQIWPGWVASPSSPLAHAAAALTMDAIELPALPPDADPALWEFFNHSASVGPLRDQEGRPVGERGFTLPDYLDGVHFELRTCPYAGSRQHHAQLMNVSALKQTADHWADFRAALELLRTRYIEAHPVRDPTRLTTLELWQMCRVMVRLPQYVHRRTVDPVDNGQLSPLVATILKVVLGANVMLEHLVVRSLAGLVPLPEHVTPKFIADYSDEHGLFISIDGVCAGPPTMIDEFLSALVEGSPSLRAAAQRQRLDLQLGESGREVNTFFAYARADGAVKLASNALHARSVASGARLLAQSRQTAGAADGMVRQKLDAFDADLMARAAPYLRSFDQVQIESLAAGLEREAIRLLEDPMPGFTLQPDLRSRTEGKLLAHARTAGLDEGEVTPLVQAFVDHLAGERSALQSIAHALAATSRAAGRPAPTTPVDQSDVEALLGPTVGTLTSELLGVEVRNAATLTTVRSQSGDLIVSL